MSPDLSPLAMKAYRSSSATTLPARLTCTRRMLPLTFGPPLANSAVTSVDRLETV